MKHFRPSWRDQGDIPPSVECTSERRTVALRICLQCSDSHVSGAEWAVQGARPPGEARCRRCQAVGERPAQAAALPRPFGFRDSDCLWSLICFQTKIRCEVPRRWGSMSLGPQSCLGGPRYPGECFSFPAYWKAQLTSCRSLLGASFTFFAINF